MKMGKMGKGMKSGKMSDAMQEEMEPALDSETDPTDEAMDAHDQMKAEQDFKTLVDAHHIKKSPERIAKVHQLAGRHKSVIKSIDQLKQVYQQKYGQSGYKKKAPDDSGTGGE